MTYLDDNFLLTTNTAVSLFNECKDLPIIDYHCHLNPMEIAEDGNFRSIVEVWLGGRMPDGSYYGDHYKWRLMRANGVPEQLITGDAPDLDKFETFAATIQKAVGNPVSLWTNLELRRIFGIEQPLTSDTALSIFHRTNELLATPEFSRRNLIRRFNVEVVCTTDDPVDDLHWHKQLSEEPSFRVIPAFRPDAALKIESPGFGAWLGRLEQASGRCVSGFSDLVDALSDRIDYFDAMGSRLSDHAIGTLEFATATSAELDAMVLAARQGGEALDQHQIAAYKTALLLELWRLYHDKGWTAQLHLQAARDLNATMFGALGSDTGFDAIGDAPVVAPLAKLLDAAYSSNALPSLIVYSVNPNDWLPVASLIGCFEGDFLALGNAWWFNDTHSGIRQQLTTMAQQSLLGNFIGMTTDSRSFLSYPRHEYFRRILADLVGEWAERGEISDNPDQLSTLVRDVSYYNAKRYFD